MGSSFRVTADAWKEDLRFLRSEFPARHKNAFHSMSGEDFEDGLDELIRRAAERSPRENIVELARLLAKVGDGHSGLRLLRDPEFGFSRLPVELYEFSDGLFVRRATEDAASQVGSRVLAIGGVPAAEAFARAAELVNRDNEMGVLDSVPQLLTSPEILHALGFSPSPSSAQLRLAGPDGREAEVSLSAVDRDGPWVDANSGVESPWWLAGLERPYWFEHLPEHALVYMQFSRVANADDESYADFCSRMFEFIEAQRAERLVVDIRLNGGGNGYLVQALTHGIVRSTRINQRGHLFAVLGRKTFSAAMFLAADLEAHTQAVFLGEPTGGRQNHYGESGKFILPNSGLPVCYSWLYWQLSDARDERPWIGPHFETPLSSADYAAGRDPAMRSALDAIESGESFAELGWNRTRWREGATAYEHHYSPSTGGH